jgi:putative nucleotidyltransferase with HDIG domain
MIMVGSLCLVFLLLAQTVFSDNYDYEIGSIVTEDVFLTKDIIDNAATEEQRAQAMDQVEPITYIEFSKLVESRKTLTDFFKTIIELKEQYSNDVELLKRVYAGIAKDNIYGFSEEQLNALAVISEEKLNIIKNYALDITSENMSNGISADEIKAINTSVDTYIETINNMRDIEKTLLRGLVEGSITINEFIDLQKTDEKKALAASQVEEVIYKKGSIIAYEGDELSAHQYAIMADADMLSKGISQNWHSLLGLAILLLSVWLFIHITLWFYEIRIMQEVHLYALFMAILLLTLFLTPVFKAVSIYILPLPLFGMLVAMMFDVIIIIPMGILLMILLTLWHSLTLQITLMFLVGLMLSAYLSRHIKQRSQLVMTGFYTGLAMAVFYTGTFLMNGFDIRVWAMNLFFILGSGIVSAIIAIGIMPIFEAIFHVLTPFKLLELSNPNRDILKRLMLEAPGTYHHSIMVGNLAETAAHDIGADSVLTRVSSFYHDIGKLERPYYFKENQIGNENPHDKLPPQISANILKQHVSYGLELADQIKLPKEIKAIIAEHHGSTIIQYFYHIEKQKNDDADTAPFKYPGPKPTTKEAVIVMLADSVEAAVRSLKDPTKEAVTELVNKIVSQKSAEDQLSDAPITLQELKIIKKSFVSVLSGIFHERIVYPEVNVEPPKPIQKGFQKNKKKNTRGLHENNHRNYK